MPRKRVVAIVSACVLGLLVLYLIAQNQGSNAVDDDPVIPTSAEDQVRARIGDTFIYQSQIDLARVALDKRARSSDTPLSDDDIINHLIQQRLLSKDAIDNGLLDDIQTRNRIRMARDQILANQWIEAYLEQNVTESVVRAYYEAERSVWRPQTQIRARHIVLPDQATAMEIFRRLNAEESFASLALAYSLDRASREAGGDLGYINRDMLNPKLSQRIFAAVDGARLEPFQTEQGWHVVEVLSRRTEAQPDYDTRHPEIQALLRAKSVETLLQNLKSNTKIELYPRQSEKFE